MTTDILQTLSQIIAERRQKDPAESYTARLHQKGLDAILKKIGEEAGEVIIAAKNQNSKEITHEVADLWFHTMVMLSFLEVPYEAIVEELQKRMRSPNHD